MARSGRSTRKRGGARRNEGRGSGRLTPTERAQGSPGLGLARSAARGMAKTPRWPPAGLRRAAWARVSNATKSPESSQRWEVSRFLESSERFRNRERRRFPAWGQPLSAVVWSESVSAVALRCAEEPFRRGPHCASFDARIVCGQSISDKHRTRSKLCATSTAPHANSSKARSTSTGADRKVACILASSKTGADRI